MGGIKIKLAVLSEWPPGETLRDQDPNTRAPGRNEGEGGRVVKIGLEKGEKEVGREEDWDSAFDINFAKAYLISFE